MSERVTQLPEGIHSSLRGAVFLYYEAQLILTGQKEGDVTEAQNISSAMALVIASGFYSFHKIGRASDFFAQIPVPPEPNLFLEQPLVPVSVVFQALQEASVVLEQDQSKEAGGKNIYIATVGRNNVGKGVVTGYLQKKYGFQAHPLSDRVREIAAALGNTAPYSRDTLITVGKSIKATFDAAVLIRHAVALLSELARPNRLLFDGLRVEGEATGLLELASAGTQTACIAITTGEETAEDDLRVRYLRALERGSDKDPRVDTEEAFQVFKEQDERESPGITAAMKHATYTITNRDGDLAATLAQLDGVMKQLGVAPV